MVKAVFHALRALSSEIDRLDGVAAEQFGLNRTDHRALDILDRLGAIPAKALAEALGLTTGGVTTVIDRLEAAGYARRKLDPIDRRRVLVEPTEQMGERQSQVFGSLIAAQLKLIANYDDAELAVIQGFLEGTQVLISSHIRLG